MFSCIFQVLELGDITQKHSHFVNVVTLIQNNHARAFIWSANLDFRIGFEVTYSDQAIVLHLEIRQVVLNPTVSVSEISYTSLALSASFASLDTGMCSNS